MARSGKYEGGAIVDTNVALTANGASSFSAGCQYACIQELRHLMKDGKLVIDDGWHIIREYTNKLSSSGQPGIGDAFLKWVLTNWKNPDRCSCVKISPRGSNAGSVPVDFEECPDHEDLRDFDPSDRKFLAVAMAHGGSVPILQATDSKWVGWAAALAEVGIDVRFLCPKELKKVYQDKMG